MRTLLAICLISLLTSCASTAYNRSFIMGDNHSLQEVKFPVAEAEHPACCVD